MRVLEASVNYEGEAATLFFDDSGDPLFGGWGLERADGVAVIRPLTDLLSRVTDEEDPTTVRDRVEADLLAKIKKDISSATTVDAVQASLNRARSTLEHVQNYERNIEIFVQQRAEQGVDEEEPSA